MYTLCIKTHLWGKLNYYLSVFVHCCGFVSPRKLTNMFIGFILILTTLLAKRLLTKFFTKHRVIDRVLNSCMQRPLLLKWSFIRVKDLKLLIYFNKRHVDTKLYNVHFNTRVLYAQWSLLIFFDMFIVILVILHLLNYC